MRYKKEVWIIGILIAVILIAAASAANNTFTIPIALNGSNNSINETAADAEDNSTNVFTIPIVSESVIISGIDLQINENSVIVKWNTNIDSDSKVEYSLTDSLSQTAVNTNYGTEHLVGLIGLKPGTTYYYQITSCDENGNCASNDIDVFTTLGQAEEQVQEEEPTEEIDYSVPEEPEETPEEEAEEEPVLEEQPDEETQQFEIPIEFPQEEQTEEIDYSVPEEPIEENQTEEQIEEPEELSQENETEEPVLEELPEEENITDESEYEGFSYSASYVEGDLEIYRIQPMTVENDHNMKIGVIVYNPDYNNTTISNVKDKWSIDKIIKDQSKIIACSPSCTADGAEESLTWDGSHIIPGYGYAIFTYTVDLDNPGNGINADVDFTNNNTNYSLSNVYIADHAATAYMTMAVNGEYHEAVTVNASANQTFIAKIEETGTDKNILSSQYAIIELPAEWTDVGTTDETGVSINGNQVIYDIPSNFKNSYKTFSFYATAPSYGESWLFNGTLNGTDEEGYSHNDLFELLAATSEDNPPSSITNLGEASTGISWIYWNWTNPTEQDFDEAIVYVDGEWKINTSNNYYNATGLNPHTDYTITVHTKDYDTNVNDTDANDTATTGNNAPAASNVDIHPDNPTSSDDLNCTYEYSDDDNDTESGTSFKWYKDNVLQAELTTQVISSGNTTNEDEWICEVTPSDGYDNGTAENSTAKVIGSAAPSISTITDNSDSSNPTNVGDDVNITVDWADVDQPGETARIYVCSSNNITSSGCADTTFCSTSNSADDPVSCQYTAQQSDDSIVNYYVKACDDDDTCSPASSAKTFHVNHAPAVSNENVIPDGAYTTDDLTCNYTYSDEDNDTESGTSFRWYKDNVLQAGLTTQVISSGNTTKNEVWICEITPHDGHGFAGNAVNSTNETIQNSAPEAISLVIDSTDSGDRTNGTLNSSWTFSDDDAGDSQQGYIIKWYKDDAEQAGLENSTTVASSYTAKGEAWKFSASLYDGDSWGDYSNSSALTIINTPPTAPVVDVLPDNPGNDDDLVANIVVASTDIDNDTITYSYQWYKNDVLQPGQTGTMVSKLLTSAGDTWKVVVTPNDGEEDGATAGSSETVVKYDSEVNLELDDNSTNISIEAGASVSIEASSVTPSSGYIELYRAGVLIDNGTSPLLKSEQFNDVGEFNITTYFPETQSYLASSETHYVIVNDTTNPSVTNVRPVSGTLYEQDNPVTIKATVSDINLDDVKTNVSWNGGNELLDMNLNAGQYTALFINTSAIGRYNATIIANDTSGNINNTEATWFNITTETDTNPPAVNLMSPENNSWTGGGNQTFEYNVSDEYSIENCSLYIDSILNQTEDTISKEMSQYFYAQISGKQDWNWSVSCTDAGNNTGNSDTYYLSIDVTPPTANITSPANDSNTTDPTPEISFILTDNRDSNISYLIYIDNTSNEQNGTAQNGTPANISISPALSQATHTIIVEAIDSADNSQNSTALTINIVPPVVYLVSPADEYTDADGDINFTFNVADPDYDTLNCSLYINDTLNQTNESVQEGVNTTFTVTGIDEVNNQEWKIYCENTAGGNGQDTRHFNVDKSAPDYSDENTNPDSPAAYNASQEYEFNITWTDSNEITEVILEFDGTNYSYTGSNITKTGNVYTKTFDSMAAGNYTYQWHAQDEAEHWASTSAYNYTINKADTILSLTAYPGWEITQGTQTNVSCSANNDEIPVQLYRSGNNVSNPDVQTLNTGIYNYTCNSSSSQNYTSASESDELVVEESSGGRGGRATVIEPPPVEDTVECEESWNCSEWSECVDGVQSRDCTDANGCGTMKNKPKEARKCAEESELGELKKSKSEKEETIILGLEVGQRFYFYFKNEEHYIEVKQIISPTLIGFELHSEPVFFTLNTAETKSFDIDNDTTNDVFVSLDKVEENIVYVTIKISTGEEASSSGFPRAVTGKEIAIKPAEGPDPYYMVPAIILIIIFITLVSLRKVKVSEKTRKRLAALHISLVVLIVALFLASFLTKPGMIGMAVADKIGGVVNAAKIPLFAVAILAVVVSLLVVYTHHKRKNWGSAKKRHKRIKKGKPKAAKHENLKQTNQSRKSEVPKAPWYHNLRYGFADGYKKEEKQHRKIKVKKIQQHKSVKKPIEVKKNNKFNKEKTINQLKGVYKL